MTKWLVCSAFALWVQMYLKTISISLSCFFLPCQVFELTVYCSEVCQQRDTRLHALKCKKNRQEHEANRRRRTMNRWLHIGCCCWHSVRLIDTRFSVQICWSRGSTTFAAPKSWKRPFFNSLWKEFSLCKNYVERMTTNGYEVEYINVAPILQFRKN